MGIACGAILTIQGLNIKKNMGNSNEIKKSTIPDLLRIISNVQVTKK